MTEKARADFWTSKDSPDAAATVWTIKPRLNPNEIANPLRFPLVKLSERTKMLSGPGISVKITDAIGQEAMASCAIDEPPMLIDPVLAKDYESLEFKHMFGYNKNKVSVSKGKLRKFLKAIDSQLEDGRAYRMGVYGCGWAMDMI